MMKIKPDPKTCKTHKFDFCSYTGRGARERKIWSKALKQYIDAKPLTLGFRCRRCGERVERIATASERKFHAKYIDAWRKTGKKTIATVWRDFAKRFKSKDGDSYRLVGWDLMCAVEKWRTKWPNDVRQVRIDDSHFCSSDLILVEHKAPNEYMGTTVVVVPQCSGESPLEFFMYPFHLNGLLNALQAIKKAAKPVEKRELKHKQLVDRLIKKNLRHPPVKP
jgi:hypothetical protein